MHTTIQLVITFILNIIVLSIVVQISALGFIEATIAIFLNDEVI